MPDSYFLMTKNLQNKISRFIIVVLMFFVFTELKKAKQPGG